MATIALHYEKHKGQGVNGLGRHNERKRGQRHTNKNINAHKTHLNISLKANNGTYEQRIQRVIDNEYKQPKAIRKDAVKLITTTVQLGEETRTWDLDRKVKVLRSAYQVLCETHGERNVISAVIHLDETNPHLHFDFVPILNGKLTAKEVIGGRDTLKQLQSNFLQEINKKTGENFKRKADNTFNGLPQDINDRLWTQQQKHKQVIDKYWEERKGKAQDDVNTFKQQTEQQLQQQFQQLQQEQLYLKAQRDLLDKRKQNIQHLNNITKDNLEQSKQLIQNSLEVYKQLEDELTMQEFDQRMADNNIDYIQLDNMTEHIDKQVPTL